MNYIFYNVVDGKIVQIYSGNQVKLQDNSYPYIVTEANIELNKYHIKDNLLTLRLVQDTVLDKKTLTANGVDSIVLTNVPNGIFTAINTKTRETVSGAINGTDNFSTTIQGTYKIKIESSPFLDFETTIEAI